MYIKPTLLIVDNKEYPSAASAARILGYKWRNSVCSIVTMLKSKGHEVKLMIPSPIVYERDTCTHQFKTA